MNRTMIIGGAVVLALAAATAGWFVGASSAKSDAASSNVAASPQKVSAKAPLVTGKYDSVSDPAYAPRNGRPLKDVLTLLDRARFAHQYSAEGEAMAVVGELEKDEIAPALEYLQKLPPPAPISLFGAVLMRWATFDPAAAMQWADGNLTIAQREKVRGGILSAWASREPKAAWDWYLKAWADAPEPRYRLEECFPLLIHAWARQDLKGALNASISEDKHGTYDPWSGFGSLVLLDEYRDAVLQAITHDIPDPKKRQAALRGALLQWSRQKPREAAAWLDTLPGGDDGNLVWAVAESYGKLDPKENAEWLLRRTPPEKKDEVMSYGLSYWARSDPEAAGAWFETAGPSDTGAQIMASAWARRDLDKAVSWAARVSTGKRAEAVASAIATASGSYGGESSSKSASAPPDIAKYAPAAGVTAEELGKLVEKTKQTYRSRL